MANAVTADDTNEKPITTYEELLVLALMKELAATEGWKAEAEMEGGPLLALLKDGASITLEPGSQFELSGAPLETCHQICAEFRGHMAELANFSQRNGITWLGLGFHPFAAREQFTMVPKQRYPVMRDYLPTRGSMALDMMLRTATVQANYDYANTSDAIRKLRVSPSQWVSNGRLAVRASSSMTRRPVAAIADAVPSSPRNSLVRR